MVLISWARTNLAPLGMDFVGMDFLGMDFRSGKITQPGVAALTSIEANGFVDHACGLCDDCVAAA
jgi:hypothetical protein